MNAPQDLNRLYANVSDSVGKAMADILSLNVEHKDGKREIGNITEKLRSLNFTIPLAIKEPNPIKPKKRNIPKINDEPLLCIFTSRNLNYLLKNMNKRN